MRADYLTRFKPGNPGKPKGTRSSMSVAINKAFSTAFQKMQEPIKPEGWQEGDPLIPAPWSLFEWGKANPEKFYAFISRHISPQVLMELMAFESAEDGTDVDLVTMTVEARATLLLQALASARAERALRAVVTPIRPEIAVEDVAKAFEGISQTFESISQVVENECQRPT